MVANVPIIFRYFSPSRRITCRTIAIKANLITKSSFNRVGRTICKDLFMFFQIFANVLRPVFIKPDLVRLNFCVFCALGETIGLCGGFSAAACHVLLSQHAA